jgi:TRAP-type C4-dicarboxylate transport system permease small subunit
MIGVRQTSPVLQIGMHFVHASVLALLALLMIFALTRVIEMLAGISDGQPVPNADKQS